VRVDIFTNTAVPLQVILGSVANSDFATLYNSTLNGATTVTGVWVPTGNWVFANSILAVRTTNAAIYTFWVDSALVLANTTAATVPAYLFSNPQGVVAEIHGAGIEFAPTSDTR
jgi:hypothetical protein